ncbi:MAG: DUF192 domain-containing protein [Alphaproteobacteria bacterium]
MRRLQFSGLAVAALWLLGAASCAAPSAACPRDTAHALIVSANGEHCFGVEIADSPEERSRGLMHVRHLEADRGMLFLFEHARIQSFWMKNTYIPLDIIFIRPDGRIENIAARTEPLSERSVYSSAAVQAVLEINGGLSEKLGIRPGDLVRHPALDEGRPQDERGAR